MSERPRRLPVDRAALHPDSLRSWAIPENWTDEMYVCVDCGEKVLFSAQQQREWYEVHKRPIFQRPIRCQKHFEAWRQGRRAKFAMDRRLAKLEADPENMEVIQDAALAMVEFHQRTKRGNLQMALHLLRRLGTRRKLIAKAMDYCETEIGAGETEE